jgi:type III restriction enzyme
MVQRMRDDARTYLARAVEGAPEDRPENYLVSGQMVARVRSYLSDEDDVENVLLVHGKDLARFIFEQMKTHYWETPTDYRATVSRGFRLFASAGVQCSQ